MKRNSYPLAISVPSAAPAISILGAPSLPKMNTQPKLSAVIPDFMKFIDGTILVAQNAEFDTKFIRRFAGAEEYELKNQVMDTMVMARENLRQLRRHDLHTLAEHFGIVFHHHRALSDAYATAEIFIELMKMQYAK